jgi:hypothetical protein
MNILALCKRPSACELDPLCRIGRGAGRVTARRFRDWIIGYASGVAVEDRL